MIRIIGLFLDSFLFIFGGVFLLTQLKRINKPIIKWIAIILIAMGILLGIMHIIKLNQ
jgi:disulfide bond formation protein DsbB